MPTLTFDSEKHEYALDGERIPGISEILRAGGLTSEPSPYARPYMERGVRVHKAIEYDLQDDLDESSVQPDELPLVKAARKKLTELGIKILSVEHLCSHPTLRYATQIDAVGEWEGAKVVINWKTGKPYKWYPAQISGEAMILLADSPPSEAVRRLMVYLSTEKHVEVTGDAGYAEFMECYEKWKGKL